MKKIVSGKIIDVFRRDIYPGRIEIVNGKIERITKTEFIDDVYILSGLIDSHVHVESSMLIPTEFSKMIVPRGTISVVADPHEIANVHGISGVEFMMQNAEKTPVKIFFGAPSCVPATYFEANGAVIDHSDVEKLFDDECIVLSEMMNFTGVINGDKEIYKKIDVAKRRNKKIDGHALGLSNNELKKYVAAGISTDHECSTIEEALEKIDLGMKILIREGSAAKNFEALSSLIKTYTDDVMLSTDDSHPDELLKLGHIDKLIKRGLKKGYSIFDLITVASVNPVKHYDLPVGLLREGDPADFICVDDLKEFNIVSTYINGDIVFDKGINKLRSTNEIPLNNFAAYKISDEDIKVISQGENFSVNVIEAYDGDLHTKKYLWFPKAEKDTMINSDIKSDILKIIVVNRYEKSKVQTGIIKNFGLKRGAIGGTIAHDSHNIIVVGADVKSITKACNRLIELKGGIVLIDPLKNIENELPLPFSGLMTNEPGDKVAEIYEEMNRQAEELGSEFHAPFMTLAFMSLLVIPEIKIGDKGLFDVNSFNFIPVFNNGKG